MKLVFMMNEVILGSGNWINCFVNDRLTQAPASLLEVNQAVNVGVEVNLEFRLCFVVKFWVSIASLHDSSVCLPALEENEAVQTNTPLVQHSTADSAGPSTPASPSSSPSSPGLPRSASVPCSLGGSAPFQQTPPVVRHSENWRTDPVVFSLVADPLIRDGVRGRVREGGGGGASNLRTFALETAGDTNGVMSQSSRNYSDIYIVSQQNRSFIEESKSRRTSADPSHWSKTNKFHFSFPLVMSYCEQQKFMIARISQMLLDEFCFRLFFPAVRVFECCCSRCCQSTNWKLDRNLVAGTLLWSSSRVLDRSAVSCRAWSRLVSNGGLRWK